MKQLVLVGLLCLAWSQPASASVLDWPLIKQVVNVGKCVISDTGGIVSLAVKHTAGFVGDSIKLVADCLVYSANQLTGVGDPNPLHPHS